MALVALRRGGHDQCVNGSSHHHAVVTLTLNPALDLSTSVHQIEPWVKMRCDEPRFDAGGGGVNVSRVVHALGGRTIAIVALGGHVGSLVATELARQNIAVRRVRVRNGTRQNFAATEQTTGRQFRFVQRGEPMSNGEWRHCFDATVREAHDASCVVASGSLPAGVPLDFYARLADRIEPFGVPMIIDTSGPALRESILAPVDLVKPSVHELGSLVHRELHNVEDYECAAREMLAAGRCRAICVSLGGEGALLVPRDSDSTMIMAPEVTVVSTIGAGDSMVGGMALTFAQHGTVVDAVRLGVAAGTAAVLNAGTSLCHMDDVTRLAPQVGVRTIPRQPGCAGVQCQHEFAQ